MNEKKIFAMAGSVMSFNSLYKFFDDLGLAYREFIHAKNSRILRRRSKAHGIVSVEALEGGGARWRVSVRKANGCKRGYFLVW